MNNRRNIAMASIIGLILAVGLYLWQGNRSCETYKKEFEEYVEAAGLDLDTRMVRLYDQLEQWDKMEVDTKSQNAKTLLDSAQSTLTRIDYHKERYTEFRAECYPNPDGYVEGMHEIMEKWKDSIKINVIGKVKYSTYGP